MGKGFKGRAVLTYVSLGKSTRNKNRKRIFLASRHLSAECVGPIRLLEKKETGKKNTKKGYEKEKKKKGGGLSCTGEYKAGWTGTAWGREGSRGENKGGVKVRITSTGGGK